MIAGIVGGTLLPHATAAQEEPAVQVEAREVAFAATMARRDFDAFLTFISPEAVFFGRSGPLRGIDAIARAWSAHFEGDEPPFSWHPDVVEVLDSGKLAITSGPVLSPSGEEVGRFNTVWRRDSDGTWRVVFDKGS
jgi:ketosteroid isomerase-like protein